MQALNAPTSAVLQVILRKFHEESAEGVRTEYDALREKRDQLYPGCQAGEWPEESRKPATEALTVLYAMKIVGMCQLATDEIEAVKKAAGEAKEADELTASMGFIQTVFHTWFESLDVAAIAEAVFDAGVEHEKSGGPKKKKEKKETASTLIDELMAKYKPSNN